jgi:acyl dehydratase
MQNLQQGRGSRGNSMAASNSQHPEMSFLAMILLGKTVRVRVRNLTLSAKAVLLQARKQAGRGNGVLVLVSVFLTPTAPVLVLAPPVGLKTEA